MDCPSYQVYPYHFVFKAYAKRRWLGRSITDILTAEFNGGGPSLIVCSAAIANVTAPAVLVRSRPIDARRAILW